MDAPFTDRRGDGDAAFASPVQTYLERLHGRLAGETAGAVATYIPELARADPAGFALAIVTADGRRYGAGDVDAAFTIQSMSKPFAYGLALDRLGVEAVLARVGVEPTGEAFNSIVLDEVSNRPFNPMVNAGAIAVAELIGGADAASPGAATLELFARLAGRPLAIDEAVYRSESETGHRNRAIAWMMLNAGMLTGDPAAALDLYFRQCAIAVTCADMAAMAATLAAGGVNPLTGARVLGAATVRDVLTLMTTCGMYDYAGQWAYDVGLPAKSGVSGGIIAVVPGQAGIAVWSPRLDRFGNSVRGVAACKAISRDFALHVFGDRTAGREVIRRVYRADEVGSKRIRTDSQRRRLRDEGGAIAVIEAQGALYFGSAEVLTRRLAEIAEDATTIIVDFRRVSSTDAGAAALIVGAAGSLAGAGRRLVFAHVGREGPLAALRARLETAADRTGLAFAGDADEALEEAENALLAIHPIGPDAAKYAFGEIDVLAGLGAEEKRALEQAVVTIHFAAGEQILREGDAARVFLVIARGTASVWVGGAGGARRRVASVGPGFSLGEMALVAGGRRTADVFADEPVICYGFSTERLRELSAAHPAIMSTILANLVDILAHRLRDANDEIRSLV
jgi:glutaminase